MSLTIPEAINQINNYSKKLTESTASSLSTYGGKSTSKSLTIYDTKSKSIISSTDKNLITIAGNRKISPSTSAETIDFSLLSLLNLKNDTQASFDTKFSGFTNDMTKGVGVKISEFASNLVKGIPGGLAAVAGAVSAAVAGAVATLTNMASNIASAFTNALSNMYNGAVKSITAIGDKFKLLMKKPTIPSIDVAGAGKKEVVNNFYKRASGQSSTSKYIQANIPSKTGVMSAKIDNVKGTPDDKILTPQLKKDINATTTFEIDPIAKMLGLVGSLQPTKSEKKIEEPKPTGDKAEYGKIQIKENKGGFVIIADETPGNVRQIFQHPTGTMTAMLDNGDLNSKCTHDRQDLTDGNWNITTTLDKVEIVAGNTKIEIRKNITTKVLGNDDYDLTGTKNEVVGGDVTNDYKSNYTGKISSNYMESVGGNKTEKTGGNLKETVGGNHEETVNGNLTIKVSGNVNITAGGSCNITSGGSCSITSGSNIKISAPKVAIG